MDMRNLLRKNKEPAAKDDKAGADKTAMKTDTKVGTGGPVADQISKVDSAMKSGTESKPEKTAVEKPEKTAVEKPEKTAVENTVTQAEIAPGKNPPKADEKRKMAIGTIEAGPLAAQSVAFIKPNKFHAIDDRELDFLMKFEKPFSLFFAAVFAGVFFGTVYPAWQAASLFAAGRGGGTVEMAFMLVCAASFGIAIASVCVTLRSKTKIAQQLEKIRTRSKLYLPPDHPAVPNDSV